MRFEAGWVKLHRKLSASDIGQNGYCLAIATTLFMWANRFPSTVRWKGAARELPKGSLVIGIREIADHLKFSKDTVHRQLKYLVSRDTIRMESATEGTVITIVNYDQYQDSDESLRHDIGHECDAAKDTSATPAERSVGHEPTPNGEDKKERIGRSPKISEPSQVISELSGDPAVEEILKTVREKCQRSWVSLYQDPAWIRREILKAAAYAEANPRKKPKKSWARFLGSWLTRGSEWARAKAPAGGLINTTPMRLEDIA